MWSTATWTRVSDATAVTFSINCFNPLKLYPLSGNIFRKWMKDDDDDDDDDDDEYCCVRDWSKRISTDQARATFEHALRLDQEFGTSFTGSVQQQLTFHRCLSRTTWVMWQRTNIDPGSKKTCFFKENPTRWVLLCLSRVFKFQCVV